MYTHGMDELFFRFIALCKRINSQPHRLKELAFLDWVLSKALRESMDNYVAETKQLLHSSEMNLYLFSLLSYLSELRLRLD